MNFFDRQLDRWHRPPRASISPSPTRCQSTRETLAPVDGLPHLETAPAHPRIARNAPRPQHAIQPGRRHFERVMSRDRISRIEQLAHRAAHALAVVHRNPAVESMYNRSNPPPARGRTPVPTARSRGPPRRAQAARSADLEASVTSGSLIRVFSPQKRKMGPRPILATLPFLAASGVPGGRGPSVPNPLAKGAPVAGVLWRRP